MDLLAKATALAAGVVRVVVASASTLDDDHSGLRYFEALLDRSFGLELRHKTLFLVWRQCLRTLWPRSQAAAKQPPFAGADDQKRDLLAPDIGLLRSSRILIYRLIATGSQLFLCC